MGCDAQLAERQSSRGKCPLGNRGIFSGKCPENKLSAGYLGQIVLEIFWEYHGENVQDRKWPGNVWGII